jgi:hypothetical protein
MAAQRSHVAPLHQCRTSECDVILSPLNGHNIDAFLFFLVFLVLISLSPVPSLSRTMLLPLVVLSLLPSILAPLQTSPPARDTVNTVQLSSKSMCIVWTLHGDFPSSPPPPRQPYIWPRLAAYVSTPISLARYV